MELYRKKINIENKPKRGRNMRPDNNPNRKNIYFHKMLRENLSRPKNESVDLSSAGENMNNIRSSMEEIFSSDENKKKAIKYVIDLGKMRYIRNSPKKRAERNKKSASPHLHGGGTIISGNIESSGITPIRSYYDGREGRDYNTYARFNPQNDPNNSNNNRLTPNTVTNFYPNGRNYSRLNRNRNRVQYPGQMQYSMNDEDDYNENPQNYNNYNLEESQNDYYDLSSAEDRNIQVIKNVRSPEPRMVAKAQQVLRERYQNAQRQQNYPQKPINDNRMIQRHLI